MLVCVWKCLHVSVCARRRYVYDRVLVSMRIGETVQSTLRLISFIRSVHSIFKFSSKRTVTNFIPAVCDLVFFLLRISVEQNQHFRLRSTTTE